MTHQAVSITSSQIPCWSFSVIICSIFSTARNINQSEISIIKSINQSEESIYLQDFLPASSADHQPDQSEESINLVNQSEQSFTWHARLLRRKIPALWLNLKFIKITVTHPCSCFYLFSCTNHHQWDCMKTTSYLSSSLQSETMWSNISTSLL